MRVYPVIHVTDVQQVLNQARTALRHDIDGLFLIDHDADDHRLTNCVLAARQAHPDVFLGVNYIRRTAAQALRIMTRQIGAALPLVDAIWADNSGVQLDGDESILQDLRSARAEIGWQGIHFGGIAFKYQPPVPATQLPVLATLAAQHIDIPTTSGPGTGREVDTAKLRALRQGLGDHPLALASGVRPENASLFVGLVDHVLVSSGVCDAQDRIDEHRLGDLLAAAHA
ncbi:hypothetical protein [Leekyejoonella antrihumi]|uniref:Adenine phosphoribosyltransferase n=1 Tax=Leekyejoonella antrihumi TaxID=1660198 RepID=A0A563DSQ6_9MICO|nr:hypothetical protein [Leekyejoonella antrihumi]TWP32961.1 hypothetical protein FGL98_22740 [Leekyejoonella antrihumi]